MMDRETDLTMDSVFTPRSDWRSRYPWVTKDSDWLQILDNKSLTYFPWENVDVWEGGLVIEDNRAPRSNNSVTSENFYGGLFNPFIMGSCAERKKAAWWINAFIEEECANNEKCHRCDRGMDAYTKIFQEHPWLCNACDDQMEHDRHQPEGWYDGSNIEARDMSRRFFVEY